MFYKYINDNFIVGVGTGLGGEEITEQELAELEEKSLSQLLQDMGVSYEKLMNVIENIYEKLLADKLSSMLNSVDIQKIVEEKVNAMDTMDLENLVMSVMKTELNAVINLGALIGLIIGILNVLVNII